MLESEFNEQKLNKLAQEMKLAIANFVTESSKMKYSKQKDETIQTTKSYCVNSIQFLLSILSEIK